MPSQKPVVRPNTGNPLRQPAETPRTRFLVAEVTPEEYKEILDYCIDRKISVSQFLAELVLEDATAAKTHRPNVQVKARFELTAEEHDKLELLVHLYRKESVSELLRDLLQPHLELQRLHVPIETQEMRFYLSDEEHELVTQHITDAGIAARKYVSFLAVKTVRKNRRKRG